MKKLKTIYLAILLGGIYLLLFHIHVPTQLNNNNNKEFRYSPKDDDFNFSTTFNSQNNNIPNIPTPKPKKTVINRNNEIPQISKVAIYGEANIRNYYEMPKNMKELADSTVALVLKKNLYYDPKTEKYKPVTAPPLIKERNNISDKETLFNDEKALSYCSGFFVSPSQVITAGHCVKKWYNGELILKPEDIYVVSGWKRESKDKFNLEFSKDDVYEVNDAIKKEDGNEDWAILFLKKNEGNKKPLVLDRLDLYSEGDPVFVVGYPLGMSVKLADDAKIFKITDERLLMNSDTFFGNSGSPVFNKYNRVIGILVSGRDDFGFIISQRKSFTIEYNKNESKEKKEEIENFVLKLKEEGIADIERLEKENKIIYNITLTEGTRINWYYHPLTLRVALNIVENAYAYYKENDPGEEAQRINSTIKQLVPLTKEERFLCRKIQNNMIKITKPHLIKQIDPQLNMLYKNLQCDKDKEI
jgi:V8-like Glu-specific endopeptidase